MRRIIASAPGKIHFLGEHSVVYGQPALLAAINLRCAVTLQEKETPEIEIVSRNLNQRITLTVEEIEKTREDAQEKWEKYAESLDISILHSITQNNLLSYAIIVIGEAFHYFRASSGGFQVIIDSEIPIGSGFGSSSAIAVSLATVIMTFLDQKYDKAAINEIALRAEQKQHGFPSGADVATSVYGGLMWFKKNGDEKIIEPLRFKIPERISKNFLVVDTGKPVESSGEMVGYVKKLYIAEKEYVETFLESQGKLTVELGHALEEGNEEGLMKIIKEGEHNLEKLGVVSEYVKQLIREIENAGGVAKICGGGGRKHATGILLSYHPDPDALQEVLFTLNLPFFQVELGGKGVTVS